MTSSGAINAIGLALSPLQQGHATCRPPSPATAPLSKPHSADLSTMSTSATRTRIFTREEAALAYALAAERLLGGDPSFLDGHRPIVPVFVTLLFQSLEISIKHIGIASGLFTEREARTRSVRSGHGIQELATLAVDRLQGKPFDPLVQALTISQTTPLHAEIIRKMINGAEFERTRGSYAARKLAYGEVVDGDFAIVDDVVTWVAAVKATAIDLPRIVSVVSQWKSTAGASGPFAVWLLGWRPA